MKESHFPLKRDKQFPFTNIHALCYALKREREFERERQKEREKKSAHSRIISHKSRERERDTTMDEFALFQSEIQELEETNAKEESKEEDKVPIQFRKNAGVVISAPAAIKADAFEPRGRPVSPEKKEEDDGFGGAIGPNFQPPPPPPPQVSNALGPQHSIKTVGQPVARHVAGEKWIDNTLSEWPANDYRIFVGDLGPECTDEQLAKAFSAYGSFAKARVVRDKKTMKSKGYGFVSMMDSMDFAKAMKEVHGKWIGSRPCKLRKSSWEERNDQTAAKSNSKRKGGGKNLGGLGEFAGGKRKKGGGYGLKHSRKHLAVAPSIEKYKAKNK